MNFTRPGDFRVNSPDCFVPKQVARHHNGDWLARCCENGMAKIAFNVNRKGGLNFVHSTIVPANRSEQARFGLLDGTVIAFFVLLCAAGLVLLLRQ